MQRDLRSTSDAVRALAPDSYVPRVRPFHIRVDAAVLADLDARLARTRWDDAFADAGWKAGTDRRYLRELVAYWRVGFDWRAQEARLAELPQVVVSLGGQELHALHLRAEGPRSAALPLLLLHGWPDSFLRYAAVAPELARAGFDVIVPSLPGFAFSPPLAPAPRTRYLAHVAHLLVALMAELGYARFGVVGGDGGSVLAQLLAIEHPAAVSAIHVTDLGWHVAGTDPRLLGRRERRYLARLRERSSSDGGYALVQATRPRSLAVALADSPVGLASWIVDRFHAWSDGNLDARFGKDLLLANIMLYWITQSIGTSIAAYREEQRAPSLVADDRVDCPVGVCLFPREPGGIPPRALADRTLAIARWTEMPRGGHLGAMEEPALFAKDVIAFFSSAIVRGAR